MPDPADPIIALKSAFERFVDWLAGFVEPAAPLAAVPAPLAAVPDPPAEATAEAPAEPVTVPVEAGDEATFPASDFQPSPAGEDIPQPLRSEAEGGADLPVEPPGFGEPEATVDTVKPDAETDVPTTGPPASV